MVSYGLKIKNEYSVFKDTIRIFRAAVKFIIPIALEHHETYKELPLKKQQRYIEILIHGTKRIRPKYKFDEKFYKFPCYFRRSAITVAIGVVEKYIKEIKRWEDNGKTYKRPHLCINNAIMPIFFRNNTFVEKNGVMRVKVFKNNDWVYIPVNIRKTDLDYINKHFDLKTSCSPVLRQANKRFYLQFAFETSITNKFVKNIDVNKVIGVDLGLINDAVCSTIDINGTVTGSVFINSPVEKDRLGHLLNQIRRCNHEGTLKCRKLWRWVKNYNKAIEINTARKIVEFAVSQNAQVIVFEYLSQGKIRGSNAMKIHMWCKRSIQKRVKEMASRVGIRVSLVSAKNTSKLAFDGSGEVIRLAKNHSLCIFNNGKRYNCDLSASKNIGARFFLRVIEKSMPETSWSELSAKVSDLSVRTGQTLSTLINLNAVLTTNYRLVS